MVTTTTEVTIQEEDHIMEQPLVVSLNMEQEVLHHKKESIMGLHVIHREEEVVVDQGTVEVHDQVVEAMGNNS